MATKKRTFRYILLTIVIVFIIYLKNPFGEYGLSIPKSKPELSIVRSNIEWVYKPLFHPPSSITPLPTGKPQVLPRIQHNFPPQSRVDSAQLEPRRQAVKKAALKTWRSYKKYAWTHDELTPLSGQGKHTFGGYGATLVDSLDTLWIMDLKDEFYEAVDAVARIDWGNTTDTSLNMFETTIRYLGGLLAAYDLSGERILLEKAEELGALLYRAFDTPNNMPPFWLDFARAKNGDLTADDNEISSSPCSLSLEFTRLAQLTGDAKYYDAVARITAHLARTQSSTKLPGMWPTFINLRDLVFDQNTMFTIGALADSLYEYLPKMQMLLGGLEPTYHKMFKIAAETIKRHILFRPMLPDGTNVLVPGDVNVWNGPELTAEGQHLSCFAGGMFGLAGRLFENQDYMDMGAKITKGCIYAYSAFGTGVMPEIYNMMPCDSWDSCEWDEARWEKDRTNTGLPKGFTTARDPSYILRPEAIESVFIMYRITGLKEYQDAAWEMFQSICKATETEIAFAGIDDVAVTGETKKRDSMESFWMGETLKYFYLIFSPTDLISLDEYVLNTEAHPFKIPR